MRAWLFSLHLIFLFIILALRVKGEDLFFPVCEHVLALSSFCCIDKSRWKQAFSVSPCVQLFCHPRDVSQPVKQFYTVWSIYATPDYLYPTHFKEWEGTLKIVRLQCNGISWSWRAICRIIKMLFCKRIILFNIQMHVFPVNQSFWTLQTKACHFVNMM